MRCALIVLIGCSSSAPKLESRQAPIVAPADAHDVQAIDASTEEPADLGDKCKAHSQPACDALASFCDAGDAASCAKLANVYWLSGSMHDDVKARALFARACKTPGGPYDGCVELAEIDCRTQDKQKERAAITTLDRACDGKFAPACTFIGLLYTEGLCDVPYNAGAWSLGVAYYQRACDLGSLGGCTHLGLLYREGHGVPKDAARGKRLLDDACTRGDTVACDYAREP